MRKSVLVSLISTLLVLFALTACSTNPSPSAAGTSQSGAGVGMSTLTVINRSQEPIYALQMSRSTDTRWGDDHLGQHMIPVGGSFQLSNISSGSWDIRVLDTSGNTKEYRNQVFQGSSYTLEIDAYDWTSN